MFDGLRSIAGVLRSLRIYYGNAQRRAGMDELYGQFVHTGDLVFDIGAHVGDRIGAFRRLGARVVAVEPQPAPMQALRLLYRRDQAVALEAAAIGARAGEVELYLNLDNPTISSCSKTLVQAAATAPGWSGERWDKAISVPMTTLDQLATRHGAPAFIKIDVEGFEAEALAGLSRRVPALSFEFTTIQREIGEAALRRCVELGFTDFNAALGESQQFVHVDWLDADQMARWIAALPFEANSGDVYAKFSAAEFG
jgi:FkbM family methyltransferase